MNTHYAEILEIAREGDWDQAHRLIQSCSDPLACMIHGYLHRVDGDRGNAQYWYARANQAMPNNSLDEEWHRLHSLANLD